MSVYECVRVSVRTPGEGEVPKQRKLCVIDDCA